MPCTSGSSTIVGAKPMKIANCPSAIHTRLQNAVIRHVRAPLRATFSCAMNAYATAITGPQPVT